MPRHIFLTEKVPSPAIVLVLLVVMAQPSFGIPAFSREYGQFRPEQSVVYAINPINGLPMAVNSFHTNSLMPGFEFAY